LPTVRKAACSLMLFWFIATSILVIHYVFTDPQFDYRLLIVGSVVPVAGDIAGSWLSALNSVTFAVALLIVVMAATVGRRQTRRLLLGLPIGCLLHSVFGASWNTTEVFWWPFGGGDLSGAEGMLSSRGAWSLVLEVIGLSLTWWILKRNQLLSFDRLREWSRDGKLTFT
jgi:hypothetical protein